MRRCLLCLVTAAAAVCCALAPGAQPSTGPKLLIAFASVRERRAPPYPKICFYEHDGVANGKLLGSIESPDKGANNVRADMVPSLSQDGRFCAFSGQMGTTAGGRIEVWDRKENKLVPSSLNEGGDAHRTNPSLSGDGKLVAFSAWAQPGGSPRWGVYLYDLAARKLLDLPKLNGETVDQRMPALSGDGRFLAYASNAKGGVGLTDVYLYDLHDKQIITLPEMNSPSADMQPALSGDGRLVAFVSDRPGGKGGRDIYLFDRSAKKFLELPGLNSEAPEQSPSLRTGAGSWPR
jgi:hypothetical protein